MVGTGQTIGRYDLLERLGSGATGFVYRARDTSSGDTVAIKTVNIPNRGALATLRREIRALARLRHPSVVRVIDFGEHEGIPYFTMDLITGQSLLAHCRERWNPDLYRAAGGQAVITPEIIGELMAVFRRLCVPLAYVHAEGIIHGDLKPSNVIVKPDGLPVLVDFGLTSRFGGGRPPDQGWSREVLQITRAAGTLPYMAPERIRGELVDARVDLYSLGCCAYEVLVGCPPFTGSAGAVVKRAINEPARPPGEHVRGIPAELDELILRLLEKVPQKRLGYADDVARALAPFCPQAMSFASNPLPAIYLYRPRFTGRVVTRRKAAAVLTELKERGRGRALMIGGESGVGKTRLGLELVQQALRDNLRVVTAECAPASLEVPSTLHPLRRLLLAAADFSREPAGAVIADRLRQHADLLAFVEPAVGAFAEKQAPSEAGGPSPAAFRESFVAAAYETIQAMCAERPMLLLYDDVHWADELTRATIGFLTDSRRIESLGALLVCTYRPEEADQGLRRLLEAPGIEHLTLDRLDARAVGEIIQDMLALQEPPRALSAYLAKESEGNPFFVAEYLRTAVQEGIVWRDESGRWRMSEGSAQRFEETGAAGLPLPSSLKELIIRRLRGLPRAAAALCQIAAVVGRVVPLAVLQRVSELSSDALHEALETLLQRHVLDDAGESGLRFSHELLRDFAYELIPHGDLPALHRRTVEAITAVGLGATDQTLGELGLHWEKAGDLDAARRCYSEGAREAQRRYAHDIALRLARSFLGLTGEVTREGVRMRIEVIASVLEDTGRIREAQVEYERARQEAQSIGDEILEAHALRGIGMAHWFFGLRQQAATAARQAMEIEHRLADRAGLVRALILLGTVALDDGDFRTAKSRYGEAIAVARSNGDSFSEAVAQGNLAVVYHHEGNWPEARKLYEAALHTDRRRGEVRQEGIIVGNLADLLHQMGRLPEARARYEDALELHRRTGNRRFEGHTLTNLANVLGDQGHVAAAREAYRQAHVILEEIGDRSFAGYTLGGLARLERRNGTALDDVAALTEAARHDLEAGGDELYLAWLLCEIGHVALARGESAEEILAAALSHAARVGTDETASSEVGVALARLKQAQLAFAAGESLYRGEHPANIPEGWWKWRIGLEDAGT
ncbi:MAG: tetratricopeptide repeat protein [Candidatus Schekmanbacteria bacterium]|nr:tetratricopeptide repeat protein [Candidatus Schekmanbacteria bacterium]